MDRVLPKRVISSARPAVHDVAMADISLATLSDGVADSVERAARWVVQVQGHRRPASGILFRPDLVLTTAAALGEENGVRVRADDGRVLETEMAAWDPTTHLVLLKVAGLGGVAPEPSSRSPRVGHFVLAVGRSWSNVVTASSGIVSVIGGPLRTGPGRAIERVIRTNAPMHAGFTGGALIDAAGDLVGISTAASIRGLTVVIPADLAWTVAARLAEHGTVERGYVGIAAQPVRLTGAQQALAETDRALLVMGVTSGSPAESAGILVGDLIVAVESEAVRSPVDLLEQLQRYRVGEAVSLRVVRGSAPADLPVTIAKRPASQG
jgi:S1-C subfamily serine protease